MDQLVVPQVTQGVIAGSILLERVKNLDPSRRRHRIGFDRFLIDLQESCAGDRRYRLRGD
jgi:hypothetical protein